MSRINQRRFNRTVGIDYSGAKTPSASLKGVRVYLAEEAAPQVYAPPTSSARKYCTRRRIAAPQGDRWNGASVARAARDVRTMAIMMISTMTIMIMIMIMMMTVMAVMVTTMSAMMPMATDQLLVACQRQAQPFKPFRRLGPLRSRHD